VDISKKEEYLGDKEFMGIFKMSKEEFAQLPQWKKLALKRANQLF